MNVNTVRPSGFEGPSRPERDRVEKSDSKRRLEEPRRTEDAEGGRREGDRFELSFRSEEVERLERRARDLAKRVAEEDRERSEKVEHVRRNLDQIVNSRDSFERAADALYAEAVRDRRRG